MADEKNCTGPGYNAGKTANNNGILGGAYFMTIIGAAVYFIQHSTSFWTGVLAILKALVWPAFLIHKVFDLLKM